jgi:Xaa-Pro aminopeptidase
MEGFEELNSKLNSKSIQLVDIDLVAELWINRPILPLDPIFILDEKYAGKSVFEKILTVRCEMKCKSADVLILSALDDIAWLLNVRGADVAYNPVFMSYLIVQMDAFILFVDERKLNGEVKQYFGQNGIVVKNYDAVSKEISMFKAGSNIMLDPSKLNQRLFQQIPASCTVVKAASPVTKLKSIKNETEAAGFRNAMLRDGVALTKFFKWLDENVENGQLTELSVAQTLKNYRAEQALFMGESFGTIAAYGPHGAIGHYSAKPQTNAVLCDGNIFLLDSGGQYLDGTTDITRTMVIGQPTPQQKKDFTLVLKGHIALDAIHFPYGTKGHQLDVLARQALWNAGINYGHGTAHGVGHFLCVHEGPQGIRADENPTVLEVGMVLSNEPGVYREGEYGIRIENLVLVVPSMKSEFGEFLRFETLTLFPMDKCLIDWELLTSDEVKWLQNYHQVVYEKLSPLLSDVEKQWLKNKCDLSQSINPTSL